ncbi:MAG: hypothetical protein Q8K32_36440 [Archangium sp.]|nr:hypothetical protein [Archangium sp.]
MKWRVESVTQFSGLAYAAILVADRTPPIGTTLLCVQTGARYRLLSIGTSSAQAWARGLRALQLEPVGEVQPIEPGMELCAVDQL